MTVPPRTRALAAALVALALLVPGASAQDAKPAAPGAKPELSPTDLYAARKPEILVQIGSKLEAAASFGWGNDLKKSAVEVYRRIRAEFDPENRKSLEQLGFEKKDGAWVANEAKQKKIEDLDDSAKGEKHRGDFDKKLKDAETASAKLLAELGDLAQKAAEEDAAKEYWRRALDLDDQNPVANERMGNKKVDGKWYTGRAIAHKEFDKVYKATLAKAQAMPVSPVLCEESTGMFEAAKIEKFRKYRTKNFRIESNLGDQEIRDSLTWLERARQFYIDLFQVPERLLDYQADPDVFVICLNDEQRDKLIDACTGIPDKEKSFKKKFGAVAVTFKLMIARFQNGATAERECLHTATHSFVHDTFGQHAPWLSEALANAVSAAVKGADLRVCFSGEGSTGGIHLENISLEQTPSLLRELIKQKKDSPIAEFVMLPSDGMTSQMIAKAWSIVMYLMETDRSQAREYFSAAGSGNNGDSSKDDKVLKQFFPAWDNWKALDADWRQWAADVYKPVIRAAGPRGSPSRGAGAAYWSVGG